MTRKSILVVGEALIDLVPDMTGVVRSHLGGGPFNVARALGRLGEKVSFLGRISRDDFGERQARALTADSVALPPTLRDDRPSGLAVAELDAEGQAAYRFELEGCAASGLTTLDVAPFAATTPDAVYAGGLGLVLQPLASATEAIVSELADSCLVYVDPNVRPAAIDDMQAYRARLDRVLTRADVVKVSDADLACLFPGVEAEKAARSLLGAGPSLVLLTVGAGGAVALGSFGRVGLAAPSVTVADTVGAGDAFSGAWLARWLRTDRRLDDIRSVADATKFAVRAAAWACERFGAAPLSSREIAERERAMPEA